MTDITNKQKSAIITLVVVFITLILMVGGGRAILDAYARTKPLECNIVAQTKMMERYGDVTVAYLTRGDDKGWIVDFTSRTSGLGLKAQFRSNDMCTAADHVYNSVMREIGSK